MTDFQIHFPTFVDEKETRFKNSKDRGSKKIIDKAVMDLGAPEWCKCTTRF